MRTLLSTKGSIKLYPGIYECEMLLKTSMSHLTKVKQGSQVLIPGQVHSEDK